MDSKSGTQVGSLRSIWQFPVKSLGGVQLDQADVTRGGLVGDRAFAFIDQTNQKVASAKFPNKWSRLLELSARYAMNSDLNYESGTVQITSKEGLSVLSSSPQADAKMSAFLGRPVKLSATKPERVSLERLDPLVLQETIIDIGELMPDENFADFAEVHLLTTASLEHLASLTPDIDIDERRFRANLVIETDSACSDFTENDWIGKTLSIGSDVQITISDPTPRCAVPTLGMPGLQADKGLIKAIANENMIKVPFLDNSIAPCFGVYGSVIRTGAIRVNDPVSIE